MIVTNHNRPGESRSSPRPCLLLIQHKTRATIRGRGTLILHTPPTRPARPTLFRVTKKFPDPWIPGGTFRRQLPIGAAVT